MAAATVVLTGAVVSGVVSTGRPPQAAASVSAVRFLSTPAASTPAARQRGGGGHGASPGPASAALGRSPVIPGTPSLHTDGRRGVHSLGRPAPAERSHGAAGATRASAKPHDTKPRGGHTGSAKQGRTATTAAHRPQHATRHTRHATRHTRHTARHTRHTARHTRHTARPWHSVLGIDSMYGVPASSLAHSGIHFEARYIEPGNPKTLTRPELAAMQRRGVRLVAVWEDRATGMLGGYRVGRWAAQQAQRGLRGLGIPHAVVYFCADFDVAPGQQPAVNSYLRGAASVMGPARVGLYGSYWVIKRAFAAHVIRYAWQTYAWSGGHWAPGAALHQYRVNQYRGGVPVDLNVAVHRNYGAVYPHH